MNRFEYKDKKSKNYFEGWYLRVTDEENNVNFAFIFAITKDETDPHSFIQVYDGIALTNEYYRFDVKDFSFNNNTVFIENNYLSLKNMHLKVKDLEIDIELKNTVTINKKSAMSYMSKFPLECFQEVNIMDGNFSGTLMLKNNKNKISGKSYMEKTFGNKFPESWIWIQSNYFDKPVALTSAYGKIPILKWKVKGFFTILNYNGKEYRFASYNLSRLKINKISNSKVELTLKRGFHKLVINCEMVTPVKLVGPLENGKMKLDVFESINSIVNLTLYKRNNIVFETIGTNAGFELVI